MTARGWLFAMGGVTLIGLAMGLLGCGDSCQDIATQKCASDFGDAAGEGAEYDDCYRQALAECGYTP